MADRTDASIVPASDVHVATPGEELSLLVTWGAGLFYWAESGANPAVRSYWDALHYISTALSVGYANVFPVTPLGKAIGAVVMTIGPALSARALDGIPRPAEPDANEASARAVVAKLEEILVELRRLNA
jgi:hypothetical protein